ncbi:ABC transporter permease [Enterococcus sp. 2201sp1_2201st1_B8_2201SCRN_220225]|uniref:ABC transporter permease n=1 Tax=unclassified Enterococcus TaxID=2608891 RepID=UPI0034A4B3B7
MKEFTKKKFNLIMIMTWVCLIALWWIATTSGLVNSQLIPSPKQTWETFLDIAKNGYNGTSLWGQLGISFYRMFVASFLAIITAIPLGLLSGYFLPFQAVFDSLVQFYRPLPPLAYYTLLILWLGIDDTSKITLLFLAAFAPIYVACVSAVSRVNKDYILSGQSLGANRRQVFFTIIFPACLPQIFTGVRTAIGVAYTTLVAAEMVAATSGIGWMVIDASRYLKSDVMFVGIIIMGITGVLLDVLLRQIEKRVVFWEAE